jgi:hypothetical protein
VIDPAAMQQMQALPPEAQVPVAPPMPPGLGMPVPPMGPGAGPMGAPAEPQKKPPLLLPPRLAKQLAQGYVDAARQNAQLISDVTGPPDDFERFPLKEQVKAWHKRDIRQDPYALREQGLSDVEIRDKVYPLRRILLKMVGPSPTDRAKFAARMRAERMRADRIEGESPS